MRELPILMNGAMVRAVLEGRKTVTRRLLKPQPSAGFDYAHPTQFDPGVVAFTGFQPTPGILAGTWIERKSPYMVGDRLYVRESFAMVHPLAIAAGRFSIACTAGIPGPPPVPYRLIYRADGEYPPVYQLGSIGHPYRKTEPFTCEKMGIKSFVEHHGWTPSIQMPKTYARIWLELTAVRVERLQDITTEQIVAEGLTSQLREHDAVVDLRQQFEALWDGLAKPETRWADNPWVWVVEFRRVDHVPGQVTTEYRGCPMETVEP